MPVKATLAFVISGAITLVVVFKLIGGFGMWSIALGLSLVFILLGLRFKAIQPFAKAICGMASGISALFIVMSLIGSTIGSGMSPEFKPLFGCLILLCISGFLVARSNTSIVKTDDAT